MKDIITRVEGMEEKIKDIDNKVQNLDEKIKKKTEANDVTVTFERLMKEEKLVTASDLENLKEKMEADANERHLNLIKWIVGTGISSIMAITGMIRLFI
ncbi:hypothetical protein [Radiobacillus sp. PE A8.2]|uniref:hypothetical protein n=1 Tax=Radiobacillus sp. PE A8.2 TaxID=3380349 RepID=UPI00388FEC8D